MVRNLILIAIAVVFTATLAEARSPRDYARAGSAGTVTAYEADGRTVIETKSCFRTSRYNTYNYSSCMSRLRNDVKRELCRKQGSGTHTYYTQMGDRRPLRTTVFCRR